MHTKKKIGLLASVPLFSLLLLGCPGDEAPPDRPVAEPGTPPTVGPAPDVQLPPGVTAEMVTEGQQLFVGQANCFTCHAQDGTGTPLGPNLTDDQWINAQTGSFDEIVAIVSTGVTDPVEYPAPMPARGGAQITDEQVRAVAAYVYSISRGS